MRKRQPPPRPKRTPALPASVPRDRLLHAIDRHEPLLSGSLAGMDTRWMPRRNVIRVSFDFDIDDYLRLAGDR